MQNAECGMKNGTAQQRQCAVSAWGKGATRWWSQRDGADGVLSPSRRDGVEIAQHVSAGTWMMGMGSVPEGRLKSSSSAVPPGLDIVNDAYPALKCRAISTSSLRDGWPIAVANGPC